MGKPGKDASVWSLKLFGCQEPETRSPVSVCAHGVLKSMAAGSFFEVPFVLGHIVWGHCEVASAAGEQELAASQLKKLVSP